MADSKTPKRLSGASREEEAVHLRSTGSFLDYTVISSDKGGHGKAVSGQSTAEGGIIGTVKDSLFDDTIMAIRYIVVSPGDRLPGRIVLISPLALQEPDWELPHLVTTLTQEQIRRAPPLAPEEPVSRLHQIDLFMYYGWLPYWMEEEYYTVASPPPPAPPRSRFEQETARDPHLFSTTELTEYRIQALDGDAGHIEDFIMDEEDWVIHYMVVAVESPLPEEESNRSVLVSVEWVERIVREEERVYVELDRATVMSSPEYDPAVPLTREYELKLYDHYGRPRYWEAGGDVEEDDDMRFLS